MALSPFLNMGVMFAKSQSDGSSPDDKDLLKIWVNAGVISVAYDFRIFAETPSGPGGGGGGWAHVF